MATRTAQRHSAEVEADPAKAVKEVVRGDPGRAYRRVVPALLVICGAGFILTTIENVFGVFAAQDITLERAVQSISWGPLAALMDFTNSLGGIRQVILGAVILAVTFVFNRRGGLLLAMGGLASGIDQVVKVLIHEPRPLASVVHVLEKANGYSYPSGHAVFYTWVYLLLAVAIAPRLRARLRPYLFLLAAVLIFFACLGRVYAGAHWPSDVLGGFFLGAAWSFFLLWGPERFLPQPKVTPKQ